MPPDAKLVLVVRADLSPGQQAVQAAHALTEFILRCPEVASEWFQISNTLALLSAPNEPSLTLLAADAVHAGIASTCFREPDLDNSLTALCLEPGPKTRTLTKRLPLALKD